MKVFVDTWGWITLYNRREKRHEEVENWFGNFRTSILYTSDYILDETFALIFLRTHIDIAMKTIEKIDKSIKEGFLILERITPARFEKAKRLRQKYQDKPKISFTDLTTSVVMTEKNIEAILTMDSHFSYLETGFQIFPDLGRE